MNTSNFITASAEITTITSLVKGDVYKRLEENSYSEDSIVHGVVLDVLYNGTDAAIQTMEFKSSYSSLETTFKVFSGNKDIKIFPSNQAEVEKYLADCVKSVEREVESNKKKLAESETKLAQAQEIVSGDLIKQLNTPAHTSGKSILE